MINPPKPYHANPQSNWGVEQPDKTVYICKEIDRAISHVKSAANLYCSGYLLDALEILENIRVELDLATMNA